MDTVEMKNPIILTEETQDANNTESAENFQKFIYELFDKNGILNDLRAYLRGHIIEVLKNSQTGDPPPCQKHFTQRLEPKFQALNMLIAEYLLCMEFSYSLSVFVSEIPLANMVFGFANSLMYLSADGEASGLRFKENDVWSILNCLGVKCDSEHANNIVEMYKTHNDTSLLFCILKCGQLYTTTEPIHSAQSQEDSISSSSKTSENESHPRAHARLKCSHYMHCKACHARFNRLREKYRKKKHHYSKNAKGPSVNLNPLSVETFMKKMGSMERNLMNEMFEQVKSVYEAEVDMVKTEQEEQIKRSLASHAIHFQARQNELEESFKARSAALEGTIDDKKRFLWGLARALRAQHASMARAMRALRGHTQWLARKEQSLKSQLTEAGESLKVRCEEMRKQIADELVLLEENLETMKSERDSLNQERSAIDILKHDFENKIAFTEPATNSATKVNNEENLKSHYDMLTAELITLRKYLENSRSAPRCVLERSTITDVSDVNSRIVMNNETEKNVPREEVRPNVVNNLKKPKNVNFSQSNEELCPRRRSSSTWSGGDAELARLADENETLRTIAQQQSADMSQLSAHAARLQAALRTRRPRTAPARLQAALRTRRPRTAPARLQAALRTRRPRTAPARLQAALRTRRPRTAPARLQAALRTRRPRTAPARLQAALRTRRPRTAPARLQAALRTRRPRTAPARLQAALRTRRPRTAPARLQAALRTRRPRTAPARLQAALRTRRPRTAPARLQAALRTRRPRTAPARLQAALRTRRPRTAPARLQAALRTRRPRTAPARLQAALRTRRPRTAPARLQAALRTRRPRTAPARLQAALRTRRPRTAPARLQAALRTRRPRTAPARLQAALRTRRPRTAPARLQAALRTRRPRTAPARLQAALRTRRPRTAPARLQAALRTRRPRTAPARLQAALRTRRPRTAPARLQAALRTRRPRTAPARLQAALRTRRPRTAPARLHSINVSANANAFGWCKGAGEQLCFSVGHAPILVPGDVVPFVGVVGERRCARWHAAEHWRGLRRRASPLPAAATKLLATQWAAHRCNSKQTPNGGGISMSSPPSTHNGSDSQQREEDITPQAIKRDDIQFKMVTIDPPKTREKSPKSMLREAKEKLKTVPRPSSTRDKSPNKMLREAKLKLRKLEIEAEAVERSYIDFRRRRELRAADADDANLTRSANIIDPISIMRREERAGHSQSKANSNDFVNVELDKYLMKYQTNFDIGQTHFKNKNTAAEVKKPIPEGFSENNGEQAAARKFDYLGKPLSEFRKLYYTRPIRQPGNMKATSVPEPLEESNLPRNSHHTLQFYKEKKAEIRKVKHDKQKELETLQSNISKIYNLQDEPTKEAVATLFNKPEKSKGADDKNLLRVEVEGTSEIDDLKGKSDQNVLLLVESSIDPKEIAASSPDGGNNAMAAQMTIIVSPKRIEGPADASTKLPANTRRSQSPEQEAPLARNVVCGQIFDATDQRISNEPRPESGNDDSVNEPAEYPDDFSADVDNYNIKSEDEHGLSSPLSLAKTSDDDIFWE